MHASLNPLRYRNRVNFCFDIIYTLLNQSGYSNWVNFPVGKGVTNAVRLHSSGAVTLPTEVQILILASLEDVTHSWPIPPAGIKINCVFGYSSHRVMTFVEAGVFPGQCIKICGRFRR